MKVNELKNSVIYNTLKKDKKAQESALRLGRTADWTVIKQFVASIKQVLLEATLEVDNLEEVKKYKYLLRGMESIVLLPSLVEFVKEQEKKDKADKEEREKEAQRRKYNPGAFIRSAVRKIKGGEK